MDFGEAEGTRTQREDLIRQIKAESIALKSLLSLVSKELNELNKMTSDSGPLLLAIGEATASSEKLAKAGGVPLDEENLRKIADEAENMVDMTEEGSTMMSP